jgi:phosphodiesterase/alkaline phosphatase D-like protein
VPATIWHTYAAGTHEAALTVTDSTGGTATDRRSVRAAAPPTVTGSESGITSTTATLRTWVDPQGLAAQVDVEWGRTTPVTSGNASAQRFELPDGSRSTLREVPLRDLVPGERYYWRVVARSAAGTTTLAERRFDTPGPPTATTDPATSVRSTSALLNARVHPETLASTAWFEWGPTSAYGSRTPVVDVASATWERPVSATITGLKSGRTYHFRIVATNSLGRGEGVRRTFTTPWT